MGIVRFNRWLKGKHTSLKSTCLTNNYLRAKRVDALCFDYNTLIHKAAQKIFKYGDFEPTDIEVKRDMFKEYTNNPTETTTKYYDMLLKELVKMTEKIISDISPLYKIIIAVDGVVPESKMVQQRQRRYKSSLQKEKSLEEGNISFFDSNEISPGTLLMDFLDRGICEWLFSKKDSYPDVIYSSHLSIGEGEHKIFSYLRSPKFSGIYTTVIYGMDSDLVMLGLLLESKDVFLMKEYKININYLSITELKNVLDNEMEMKNGHKDFVIMLYLIGNDFVPHMPSLEERDISIDTMISVYKKLKKPIHIGNNIDWESFSELIDLLSKEEIPLLEDFGRQEIKYPLEILLRNITNDLLDYDSFRSDWYTNAFRPHGEDKYVSQFGGDIFKDVPIELLITSMCADYCSMIAWMYKYYTSGLKEIYFNQKYQYYHTPLLKDLAVFMKANISIKDEWVKSALDASKSIYILPIHQLLYILPPTSSKLIPREFGKLMFNGSPIIDYYPSSVVTELQGKYYDYEAVIYMPMIDIRRITIACDEVFNSMELFRAQAFLSYYSNKDDLVYEREKSMSDIMARVISIKGSIRHSDPNVSDSRHKRG